MLPAMASKPSITIVGAGRLGVPLAEALVRAGYPLREIVFRDGKSLEKRRRNLPRSLRRYAVSWRDAGFDAGILWLCVPDGQIKSVGRRLRPLTPWRKKIVFHSSGALTSDALQALREKGAVVASVHPVMTFVYGAKPPLKGVPFGLEGDQSGVRAARRIVRDLQGDAFLVSKQHKALYHAWATLLSPLLLSFVTTAEQVARATGIPALSARQKMLPIMRQTLSNYAARGPANSFSGPLVRGDFEIAAAHLQALTRIPEAREVYLALARAALRHLPVRNRQALETLLQ